MSSLISKLIHWRNGHNWDVTIYLYPWENHQVRRCMNPKCNRVESQVYDRDHGFRWIEGDIWSRTAEVCVVTPYKENFDEIARRLLNSTNATNVINLGIDGSEKIRGLRNPIILFDNDWWDCDVVQDPYFRMLLNGGYGQ